MKKLTALAVSAGLILLHCGSVAQDESVFGPQSPQLTITARQMGEQHCQGYPDGFSVWLKLQLRLRNESNEKVILARHMDSPPHVSVSISSDELRQGHFIYNPSVLEVSKQAPKAETFGDKPDPDRFVILDPGAEFETETWAVIIADLRISRRPSSNYGPTAGQYAMQISVRTWPYLGTGEKELTRISTAWRSSGILATTGLNSRPFLITLPRTRHARSCEQFKTPV